MIGSEYRGPILMFRMRRFSKRTAAKLRTMDMWDKVILLLIFAVVFYGTFILLDGMGVRSWLTNNFGPPYDLHIYQERTGLILNGGVIYRDLDIESPPLINYLLVPAQLMGGEWWAYELYFSLFPLLTSLGFYFSMRRYDDLRAFLVALVFLISPFAVVDATWGIQDEAIMVFLYLAPVLLLLLGNKRMSAAGVAVGFWTKFLPVILYPVTLVKLANGKERLRNLGWVIGISILIAIPFLLVCPIEFLNFPSYYLLGRSGEGSAGMSVISLIGNAGIQVPGLVGAGLTIAALIVSYYLVYRWDLDIWRGAMLTTVMFLAVYPMMHMPYYILAFAFFIVWAVEDLGIAWRVALMYALFIFGQGFQMNGVPGMHTSYYWIISLALVIGGTIVMIDLCRKCLKNKCFLDRVEREGPSSA